ncbi:ADP-ribosylglycohydrolase family protein [Kitasatospora sp. MBT63]|uniref:ADP-ribosylglycohydrolase family protein n=1 Tax=Kitasatospora sp. MBT63 TaxID=1444768 RepID=UPI000AE5CC3F|nr:ADP-ribosylglycohydrolase family protein [Kitasatospora sp. MBT63]
MPAQLPHPTTPDPYADPAPGTAPTAALDSLQGLALGDAFGDRWFHPRVDEDSVEYRTRTPRPAPWPWTDDTAMALTLVEHLAEHGEVRPDGLARAFAARYTADPDRGYGPSMHQVLRQIDGGAHWHGVTSAVFGGQGSHGNGAAMRVAPLGAWFSDDLEMVAGQAELSARVTHFHPEAVTGAVAVALAAAFAARSRGRLAPGREELLTLVADRLPAGDVRSGLRTAARFTDRTSLRHAAEVLGTGTLLSAQDTVPFALWCAAGQLDSLPQTLWQTVGGWGDMDTTCAIAGGITAARTGLAGVPGEWLAAREPLPALPLPR